MIFYLCIDYKSGYDYEWESSKHHNFGVLKRLGMYNEFFNRQAELISEEGEDYFKNLEKRSITVK
jgi:hypothetical protein